ncbi:MAG: two-component system, chemotaxis family, chemotaxis protein CheY [Blastocatellia bacterium]|jgi:CheY-like chemotaxis protein|nr:two-component system, chemotaxis family, chemotaxis protein CheY [Blastocatellia bacterium]
METFRMTLKETTPKRVLIADDDPVMRHLVTTIVKQQDCEVVLANDGRDAYRILQSDSQFTAAILDMTMPFLEGLDLIRYMRSERRLMRIPIMIITAQQDIKLMASSFAAGATAFLPKPFTPEQLQSAIRMLIGNRKPTRRAA